MKRRMMTVGTETGQGEINRTGEATRTKLTLMMEGTLETHQPHWLTQILYFGEYVTEINPPLPPAPPFSHKHQHHQHHEKHKNNQNTSMQNRMIAHHVRG